MILVKYPIPFISIAFVLLIWSHPSTAQEEDIVVDENTRNCISTRRISRIRIIDDKNILIYLNARHIYHNQLENECRGLERIGTFSYNSSDGLICEGDGISAMSMNAWDDPKPVPKCWFGIHRKISKEEADAMREAKKKGVTIESEPLPMPLPSEVGAEDDDPES